MRRPDWGSWLVSALIVGHLLAVGGGIAACVWGLAASAQSLQVDQEVKTARNTQQIEDISRRIANLEAERADARIVRLEAIAETNHTIMVAIFLSLLALLGEAVYRLFGKGRLG